MFVTVVVRYDFLRLFHELSQYHTFQSIILLFVPLAKQPGVITYLPVLGTYCSVYVLLVMHTRSAKGIEEYYSYRWEC